MPIDNIIGSIIGTGMGLGLQGINDQRQRRQSELLMRQQMEGQKEMYDFQQQKQYEMWLKTNYPAQVEQLNKAGLNVGLMYGMGGGGGATVGGSAPNVNAGDAPRGGGEIAAMSGMGMQLGMQSAQIKLLEAQAENVKADTAKKTGVDTENVKADTAVKIMEQIVREYTGKELKSQFENVNEPNRTLTQIANADQLAAASDLASVVQQLNREGKLREKSLAEIESILLNNAKSAAETANIKKQFEILEENLKGAKLDNIVKELETKLQTQTGIDKNSPAWMKILGRLFVQLFNK